MNFSYFVLLLLQKLLLLLLRMRKHHCAAGVKISEQNRSPSDRETPWQ